jgi:hypothetical protein
MQSKNLFLFFTFVLLVTCCTFETYSQKAQPSMKQLAKKSRIFQLIQASNH